MHYNSTTNNNNQASITNSSAKNLFIEPTNKNSARKSHNRSLSSSSSSSVGINYREANESQKNAPFDGSTRVIISNGFDQLRKLLGTICKGTDIVAIIYGQIDSAVVPTRDLAGKEMLIRDSRGAVAKCHFAEIDRRWPKLGRGKRVRLALIRRSEMRQDSDFQIVGVREVLNESEGKCSFALSRICEKSLVLQSGERRMLKSEI